MITFNIKANATFDAENIDDAFQKLSDHFKALAEEGLDGDDGQFIKHGAIEIAPVV
jgi:hypothetical protein